MGVLTILIIKPVYIHIQKQSITGSLLDSKEASGLPGTTPCVCEHHLAPLCYTPLPSACLSSPLRLSVCPLHSAGLSSTHRLSSQLFVSVCLSILSPQPVCLSLLSAFCLSVLSAVCLSVLSPQPVCLAYPLILSVHSSQPVCLSSPLLSTSPSVFPPVHPPFSTCPLSLATGPISYPFF